uniref:Bola-like protein n=1 Tax=Chlamydomonas leiostraca TaxID=1034604 RepID=A0A7S0S376_9CHLO|eukprot:CAMPEP_0202860966 /NCGR_PEP_ID=MMETSP1391-20130828/2520_1 /ASSEMBLY_ACC=CAM_ASM_000867 /TAXON_ID=1034604 /ORGANISM="Chlamydomonas leiostraca, Strain SAG 11-49" /LENGTH=102 /DNA_ID=CAMNT_0049540259 /DNA_START=22 /DNA_END=330 /DNA_ORIENTATION=-
MFRFAAALNPLRVSLTRGFAAKIEAITPEERAIGDKLAQAFGGANLIKVRDTSGGCGAMYNIEITAQDFAGQSTVKQHMAVHSVLKEEMAKWHGVTLVTKAP